jgi:hypothetical protein
MEVLAAFVREHSPKLGPRSEPRSGKRTPPPPDVQAALTVIGRRFVMRDRRPIDLIGADLTGASWPDVASPPDDWGRDPEGLLAWTGGDSASTRELAASIWCFARTSEFL